jgi:4-amino-4-deoxy-L-arabinose transferase-like glycosyltransferase
MILLLVLAADAVSKALATGSQRTLILAGLWVGLAFQAKMIEAWLVLPAFGLTYLLSGPDSTRRRVRQLAVAGAVAAVVSLSWLTAVSLVPAHDRPYVDGSSDNSFYSQVFVYNGFGRFGEQTPLQVLASQRIAGRAGVAEQIGIQAATPIAPSGPTRLLRRGLGRDIGWLLPGAILVAIAGIVSRRRERREDPLLACFVLWGGWLLTLAVTFSAATTINSYYTAALTPSIAAILGSGAAAAWSGARNGLGRRIGLGALLVATVGYSAWLLRHGGLHLPAWLPAAAVVSGLIGLGVVVGSILVRRDAWLAAAIGACLVAASVVPATASVELTAHHGGAFDTPFESAQQAQGIDRLFVTIPASIGPTVAKLTAAQLGAPYLLAVQTSAIASVFIDATGLEALPIGGFAGNNPSPTLGALQSDIRDGTFHLVLAAPSRDPRLRWIAGHCRPLGPTTGGLSAYFCLPTDAD